jgi:DNA-binding NtrC family response regulator
MDKNKLLIIDDDETFCSMLSNVFKEEYDVASFTDSMEAIRYFRENQTEVILTDIVMPNMDGINLLQIIKTESFETDVIMMTAFANVDSAVDAMQKGAYDYIVKPFKTEELSMRLKKVFEKRNLLNDNIALHKIVDDEYRPDKMIGENDKMKAVFRLIELYSPTELAVLITGESGTGKELVAKALHFSSKRKDKRFLTINCAAIPENLFESELFGNMKGAYSGAAVNKAGLFESAKGGTVFLDEIGEMPLSLQPKLLRVLEEKKIRRLGGTTDIAINARVLSATNRDLGTMINENKFREDLYYRINNVSIDLPALREHKDDIPLYVRHFLSGKKKIHPMALELLSQYSWPGNIRELKSIINQLMTFVDKKIIEPSDLPHHVVKFFNLLDDSGQSYTDAKKKLLDNFNREVITKALMKCYGNVTKAAKELNLDRGNFQKLMRKYQIISKEYKEKSKWDNSHT